jgi:hypothetical protein
MATKKRTDYTNDTRKIKIVIRENPHHKGTARAAAFDAVCKAKTVADYAASGNKVKYLSRWKTSGHITFIRPVKANAAPATTEASK